jgi:hypothetical protein
MFEKSRQLFHRNNVSAKPAGAMPNRPSETASRSDERHPAMRGLNVSPVHGRHCICDRCSADHRAA